MRRWRVHPARKPLRGAVRVPGDKSIGHRALILAAVATGESTLTGLSRGDDTVATRRALGALGVSVRDVADEIVQITGVGLRGLRAPRDAIACGNAGTTMRLLAGLLAAQRFDATLVGDASLSRRPMARITRPLRMRGAKIDGEFDASRNDEHAPLGIRALTAGTRLGPLEFALDVASAQVKTALILSGLDASGPTALTEPVLSRDHTERMLDALGAPIRTFGPGVFFDPSGWNGVLAPMTLRLPGDASSAAFLVVAAHAVPTSRIIVRGVGINPTRMGAFEVLRDMGGGAIAEPKGAEGGEPVGDLHVGAFEPAELRSPARVGGELAVRSIDEIPALVVAAALAARGTSEFRDLAELRVKESDRIASLVALLHAFSLDAEALPDGLRVGTGRRPRARASIATAGDHRIAMAAAVLALAADGDTEVNDVACVDTSFPNFVALLRSLGAEIDVLEGAGES